MASDMKKTQRFLAQVHQIVIGRTGWMSLTDWARDHDMPKAELVRMCGEFKSLEVKASHGRYGTVVSRRAAA